MSLSNPLIDNGRGEKGIKKGGGVSGGKGRGRGEGGNLDVGKLRKLSVIC